MPSTIKDRLAAAAASARSHAPDLVREGAGLVGAGLVTWGGYLAWAPLGYLVAGGMLMAAAILLARKAG